MLKIFVELLYNFFIFLLFFFSLFEFFNVEECRLFLHWTVQNTEKYLNICKIHKNNVEEYRYAHD